MRSSTFLLISSFISFPVSLALENVQISSAPRQGGKDQRIEQEWCKWIPGQQGWPSDQEWAQFNQQVKGRLLKPDPPAAACHRGFSEYNSDACDTVTSGFKDSAWHSDHPTSNMWQNWNNYSCMPGASRTCTTAGYPVYVVDAREPMDVKAAVDFARTKNIRLNIKSTGHDFLGRSVQPYSLSIWTHHMTKQDWFERSFTPKGCTTSIPGAAVRVGSGSQWKGINAAAKDRGLSVVSGAFSTVSVGGFLSNGGHGALSAKYGLGADQVFEIELVTPMGEIIVANECVNQDYFWAMRGGGGSTYGVALSFVIKAFPSVQASRYRTKLSGWSEITHWYKNWAKIANVGGSGYFNGYPQRDGSVSLDFTVPGMNENQLSNLVDPIMAAMNRRGGLQTREGESDADGEEIDASLDANSAASSAVSSAASSAASPEATLEASSAANETVLDGSSEASLEEAEKRRRRRRNISRRKLSYARQRGEYTFYANWSDAASAMERREPTSADNADNSQSTFPGMGTNKIIASWLWSASDLADPRMPQALRAAFDNDAQMLNDATVGVGTHRPPYIRGGGNAVNPAFRTATMRPATELQWSGTDLNVLAKKKADALRFTQSYASLSPNGGTYANEADPETPQWQHAFWGSNYPRLLDIKKRIDPWGVFYCRSCVGSELWEDNFGQLCRLGGPPKA